jgi:hypothetical protein
MPMASWHVGLGNPTFAHRYLGSCYMLMVSLAKAQHAESMHACERRRRACCA